MSSGAEDCKHAEPPPRHWSLHHDQPVDYHSSKPEETEKRLQERRWFINPFRLFSPKNVAIVVEPPPLLSPQSKSPPHTPLRGKPVSELAKKFSANKSTPTYHSLLAFETAKRYEERDFRMRRKAEQQKMHEHDGGETFGLASPTRSQQMLAKPPPASASFSTLFFGYAIAATLFALCHHQLLLMVERKGR